jgi:ubiquitin-large subunit ribosomal protein L40e
MRFVYPKTVICFEMYVASRYTYVYQIQANILSYIFNNTNQGENMARFPEAEERILNKKICMKCSARNAVRATRCRKCGYSNLRVKNKEVRRG